MLDSETKRRIDTARDILVGKLPDPKSQVEQITIALIYKFMDDMDRESEELGGKPLFFTGEFTKYSWNKIFDPSVGGMKKVKEGELDESLRLLEEPENAKKFNISFGGGILFYGPPGCGKSMLSEAIAGETQVTYIKANIAEILNKWVGNSEKNLHNLFETARMKQPSLIFFDEIEALGGDRQEVQEHWGRIFINQFLIEMDQIEKNKERILVIGATNSPWHIDLALLRSGRFTNKIFIGSPDLDDRKEIFKIHTRDIEALGNIDFNALAKITDGLSGADIESICKESAKKVWMETVRTKKERKMQTQDFVNIIEKGKKEGKFSTVNEWLEVAKNYKKQPPKERNSGKELDMFG